MLYGGIVKGSCGTRTAEHAYPKISVITACVGPSTYHPPTSARRPADELRDLHLRFTRLTPSASGYWRPDQVHGTFALRDDMSLHPICEQYIAPDGEMTQPQRGVALGLATRNVAVLFKLGRKRLATFSLYVYHVRTMRSCCASCLPLQLIKCN
jgi:hypothetical protein